MAPPARADRAMHAPGGEGGEPAEGSSCSGTHSSLLSTTQVLYLHTSNCRRPGICEPSCAVKAVAAVKGRCVALGALETRAAAGLIDCGSTAPRVAAHRMRWGPPPASQSGAAPPACRSPCSRWLHHCRLVSPPKMMKLRSDWMPYEAHKGRCYRVQHTEEASQPGGGRRHRTLSVDGRRAA